MKPGHRRRTAPSRRREDCGSGSGSGANSRFRTELTPDGEVTIFTTGPTEGIQGATWSFGASGPAGGAYVYRLEASNVTSR